MSDPSSSPGNEPRRAPESVREFLAATDENHDHEDLAVLRAELQSDKPNSGVIADIVQRLHLDPQMGATVSNWWNDPKTQSYIAEINAMGL